MADQDVQLDDIAQQEVPVIEEETREPAPQEEAAEEEQPDAQSAVQERVQRLEEALAGVTADLTRETATRERLERELALAVSQYRESLLAAAPGLPADLVTGETVQEVADSAARARRLVERVRSQLEAQAQQTRIPAGAPPRSAPDLSGLSPQEKITQGLRQAR